MAEEVAARKKAIAQASCRVLSAGRPVAVKVRYTSVTYVTLPSRAGNRGGVTFALHARRRRAAVA
eukprot:53504-Prorocentrum_minimum.AAC.1